VLDRYGMLEFKLCCKISLLLNMENMGCLYVEDCGVSKAEYLIHLVHMNRLSACREFCGVHR